MKEITLTKGQVTIVDDADYERFGVHRWHTHKNSQNFYAVRWVEVEGKPVRLLLHREIMSAPSHLTVDHIDQNTLDNRRSNLRLATRSQNQMNRRKMSRNTSGFKGIYYVPYCRKWAARIGANGKKIYLGMFASAEEAYEAYKAAAIKIHGEFARLE